MPLLPTSLGLSDREAIPDAIYRSIAGLDSRDQAMFESAWHKDAVSQVDEWPAAKGIDAILAVTFGFIGLALDTTHMVTNVRIDHKEGAETATMTAYALAQHFRKGDGMNPTASRFTTGSSYDIDLAKDSSDGLWKIKNFVLKVLWCDGDPAIVTPQAS